MNKRIFGRYSEFTQEFIMKHVLPYGHAFAVASPTASAADVSAVDAVADVAAVAAALLSLQLLVLLLPLWLLLLLPGPAQASAP